MNDTLYQSLKTSRGENHIPLQYCSNCCYASHSSNEEFCKFSRIGPSLIHEKQKKSAITSHLIRIRTKQTMKSEHTYKHVTKMAFYVIAAILLLSSCASKHGSVTGSAKPQPTSYDYGSCLSDCATTYLVGTENHTACSYGCSIVSFLNLLL